MPFLQYFSGLPVRSVQYLRRKDNFEQNGLLLGTTGAAIPPKEVFILATWTAD